MLYISRRFGEDTVGVVDTDDDTETIVTTLVLGNIVLQSGLEILGFQKQQGIPKVTIHQDERYARRVQDKVKALYGVSTRLFRDELVYMGTLSSDHHLAQTITVSSIVPKLWSKIEFEVALSQCLTLVLDDKVELDGETVPVELGVCWDIHRVTNEKLVMAVYAGLFNSNIMIQSWKDFVIDADGRDEFWKSLYRFLYMNRSTQEIDMLRSQGEKVAKVIDVMFLSDLKDLVNAKFELSGIDYIQARNKINEVWGFVTKSWHVEQPCFEYSVIRYRLVEILGVVTMNVLTAPFPNAAKLGTFISYFDVSESMMNTCIQFYNKVCDAFVRFCKFHGIPLPR